jgi:predicted amidohydrolase YtcJ
VRVRNTELGDVDLDDGTDDEIDAGGGCVIGGLHDHHIHLRALAAARASVDVSPGVDLAVALRVAPGDEWVRAIGYAGDDLDRWRLDALAPAGRPVRVQHRSGALWILNSAAARAVGLPDEHDGRLFRMDDWLRDRVPPSEHDLAAVGRDALAMGITELTDTTPGRSEEEAAALERALPQRVHLMMPLGARSFAPVKLLLDDDTLPSIDELTETVDAVHEAGRTVSVHCVTRVQLVAALAAGLAPGDRIEHGAIIPTELDAELARRQLTVVTQPNFVAERGAQYRRDVDPDDLPLLYRCGSLLRAGVRVLGGTDAPFGRPDPWAAMRAAVERDLTPDERITPAQALALFEGTHGWCVLGVPRAVALDELDAGNVVRAVLTEFR